MHAENDDEEEEEEDDVHSDVLSEMELRTLLSTMLRFSSVFSHVIPVASYDSPLDGSSSSWCRSQWGEPFNDLPDLFECPKQCLIILHELIRSLSLLFQPSTPPSCRRIAIDCNKPP